MNVELTDRARADLEKLPEIIHVRILRIFERLAAWPEVSGAKPLSGKLAGRYRMRTGDYRVQFSVRENVVMVEKIGHRDRFYEG